MITRYFKRKEFACKCGCGFDVVDIELVRILEHLRAKFGNAIIINSGCRCKSHNKSVGGSKRSQHIHGKAVDIIIIKISPRLVQEHLMDWWEGGLGSYVNFTHIDVGNKRRWKG